MLMTGARESVLNADNPELSESSNNNLAINTQNEDYDGDDKEGA